MKADFFIHKRFFWLSTMLILVLAGLSGCQPSKESIPVSSIVRSTSQAPASTLQPDTSYESASTLVEPTIVSQSDEIIKFTFPTPGSKPISLWRPPLSQAPLAINPMDHFYFVRPIAVDKPNWPLADYRYGGIFPGTDIVHTGIDIPSPRGTTVRAAGPGKVIHSGYGLYNNKNPDADPYGLAVSIQHDFGYNGWHLYTIYAHMDRIDVIQGQRVESGTPLGIVGTTGRTTGPHLHFEVRVETNSFYTTRNPELWLVPPENWGVLVGQFRNTNGSFLTRYTIHVQSIETGQKWEVATYGEAIVIRDEYFQENMVLSDLPAGEYKVWLDYLDEVTSTMVTIHPGTTTYLTFRGKQGFDHTPPPLPGPSQWLKPIETDD